jgi:hypothetical protein
VVSPRGQHFAFRGVDDLYQLQFFAGLIPCKSFVVFQFVSKCDWQGIGPERVRPYCPFCEDPLLLQTLAKEQRQNAERADFWRGALVFGPFLFTFERFC